MRWKSRVATLLAVFAIVTCGPESAAPSFDEPQLAGISFAGRQRPVLHAVDSARTEWRCVDGKPLLFVIGTVTVRNRGDAPSARLTLTGRIEQGPSAGGEWERYGALDVSVPAIPPGEAVEHAYEFPLSGWSSTETYRHVVSVASEERADESVDPAVAAALLVAEPPVNLCAVTCTLSSTYWRVHGPGVPAPYGDAWPVRSLTLGTASYAAGEIQEILRMSPGGKGGMVALAQELIAVKLNVAAGADPRAVATVVRAADALIGTRDVRTFRPERGSRSHAPALTRALKEYNLGALGPGACG